MTVSNYVVLPTGISTYYYYNYYYYRTRHYRCKFTKITKQYISTNSINHLIKVIVLEGPKHTEVTDDCCTQPILLVVLPGM